MSKSILIIDTPKNCPDCQLMADGWCYGIPSREEVQGKIKYLKRPSWCPLKDLPQKRNTGKLQGFGNFEIIWTDRIVHQNEGWNACLDEILGETE